MSNTCKHWREYDDEAGDYEYCKGAEKKHVTCGGSICNCNYPQFFNVPAHRLSLVRRNLKDFEASQRELAAFELGVR